MMKLAIVISNFLFALLDSVCMHQFKCLATVVSRSWDMSLKCPWNLVNKRFLVCPTLNTACLASDNIYEV